MSSWDIIIFEEEQSCTYVPSSWAVDTTKTLYLWPKLKSATHLKRLQDECKSPSADINYDECKAICKATVYDLPKAKELSEKLVYTSNITSASEEEENVDHMDHNTSAAVNTVSVAGVAGNDYTKKDFGIYGNLTSKLEKVNKGLATLKFEVSDLKKEVIEMRLILGKMLEKNHLTSKRKFRLPIKEDSELDEIEHDLEDEEIFAEMVSTLSLLAAEDLKKTVYSIMKRLLNKETSLKYSAMGKKGKKNFSETKLYQAVLDAIRISYPNSLEKEIVKNLSTCLATAGDREGGRKERQSRKGIEHDDAFQESAAGNA